MPTKPVSALVNTSVCNTTPLQAPEGRKRALRSQIADKMGQVKNAARNASASGEPL